MNIRYNLFFVVMCAAIFILSPVFAPRCFSQEGAPGASPEEMIEEMLADEELPAHVRKELEEMLKQGGIEPLDLEPPESGQAEIEYPYDEEYPDEEMKVLEAPETPASRAPQAKITTGTRQNRISLDLKGVDIIDVLKMLSARSNLNIVAGRNVRGRVTLFLKDVDAQDAFEIILAANDLAYETRGDIINVMTERDYEQLYGHKYYEKQELRIYKLEYGKAAEVSKALNQSKSKIGKVIVDEGSNTLVVIDSPSAITDMEKMIEEMDMPIETKIFSLDYAKAEDIKTKVSDILTKGVGTIQVDERTNKVVITDLSKRMPDISNVIMEMDEKHKEVLIETKIVEISLNDQYRYGVDWKAVFHKDPDEGFRSYFDNIAGSVFGGAATGGALTIAQVAHDYIDATVEALQTLGKTNVLSCPRITVLNNEEAKVLVGTNQPYVTETTTVTENNPITAENITYVDVGVELTVTPNINKDGYVTMKIKPKISSISSYLGTQGDRTSIPVVSTSETETTVMVQDGTTIIIAGLIEDRDEYEEDKIPILGDIPLIGALFKNKGAGSNSVPEKKELVVFLTPYIVHGNETFPEADNVWFRDSVNSATQRKLLEEHMSRAVEDIKKQRSLIAEARPYQEPEDKTTRISEDLGWFERTEYLDELERRRAKLRKEIEPVKEKGIVPDKVVTKDESEIKTAAAPPAYLTQPISGYYSYFENVRNRIYWVARDMYPRDLKGKRADVNILFKLNNDGSLSGEPEILNEVDNRLAKAAKTAVQMAAPFPPFPNRMDEPEATFKLTITYQ